VFIYYNHLYIRLIQYIKGRYDTRQVKAPGLMRMLVTPANETL